MRGIPSYAEKYYGGLSVYTVFVNGTDEWELPRDTEDDRYSRQRDIEDGAVFRIFYDWKVCFVLFRCSTCSLGLDRQKTGTMSLVASNVCFSLIELLSEANTIVMTSPDRQRCGHWSLRLQLLVSLEL